MNIRTEDVLSDPFYSQGNCVGKIYGIYGEPIIRTIGPTTSMPLQQLLHEGIVHGLCNEIVIMPIMSATQKLSGMQQSHHSADVIPFPLFMAEMLRRMRSSYFLLQTAMRYILDVESQIRSARERAVCGWCRSGVYGCEHSNPPETGGTSRFSKGRSNILRKPTAAATTSLNSSVKSADFYSHDVLHPLADPRKAFLGALILANKFHRDRSIGNKAWAAMIGLQLDEVHSAEKAIGQALGWTLSRPWIRDAKDESGSWMPGSTHPSLAEPLFASNDAEVIKYGVKSLRASGTVPLALDSNVLAREFPAGDIQVDSIYSIPPPLQSRPLPLPDALSRRNRSQTLLASEERPVAPLPHRPVQTFLQSHARASSLIKKANSAPDVMQPSFHTQQAGASLAAEIDMAMQSEYTTFTATKVSLDSFMDATPTLEQTRSKRKASNDFGPNGLRRRGILGQKMLVLSPDEMTPVGSHAKSAWVDSNQWDMCGDDESSSCPELSPGTPTATSPSIGLLTRTNTPSNLLDLVASAAQRDLLHSQKSRSSQWCVHKYVIKIPICS